MTTKMKIEEIEAVLSVGMCASEEARSLCATCQRKAAAIAEVRRLADVERAVILDIALLVLAEEDLDAVTVRLCDDGHEGPGWYAHITEYPEEGSHFLGRSFEDIRQEATGRAGVM